MEDARRLINDFKASGLLIRSDPLKVKEFREAMNRLPRLNALQPVLREIITTAFDHAANPQSAELKAARSQAELLIKGSVEYKALCVKWSDETWQNLLERFNVLAPESFIKLVVDYDTIRIENPLPSYEEDLTIQTLLEIERDTREKIKVIPGGLGYALKVISLIHQTSRGCKSYEIVRLATIPDVFVDGNPNNIPEIDPDIGRQFHYGFSLFRSEDSFHTEKYTAWFDITALMCQAQPLVYPAFRTVFPRPLVEISQMDKGISGVVKIAGAILANFYEVMPDHVAQDLILPIIYGLLKETPSFSDSFDFSVRKWLWGVGKTLALGEWTFPTWLGENLSWWRRVVEDHILPIGFVTSITSLLSTIGIALYNAIDRLLELIFLNLAHVSDVSYQSITEYFYLSRLLISSLLPEQRRRPKAVWALLFTNDFVKLTPAEKFMIGCEMMKEPTPVVDYNVWAEQRLQAMAALGVDLETEPAIPIRAFNIPKEPYVPDDETASFAPLMPDARQVNQIAADFTRRLIALGVPRGMDGMWFSTNQRIANSIQRYSTAIPPQDDVVATITLRAAHALADKFPMMYKGATVLTPRAAMNKIKLNDYSPGLPFIPRYRTRKDLAKVGIWEATIKEAERLLIAGQHPGECAHCFVKSQVVKLQKLMDEESNIRTVTASTLLSNVIQYVSTVEVTRRMPPLDAFVINARPRSEGGVRDFYEQLKTRAAVFAADITQFDSQLIPTALDALIELRSIGFDSSLVRDIAVSQIRASYLAMRHARLIDLRTGKVFAKTKGLLTGQGNTSVDNRDAFRIVILAAWSIVTGKPPSDFWEKNDLGNAGDDDAIGTDEPEVWPAVIQCIKDRFGMAVRVENEGFENLNLVGLTVGPVPSHSVKYYTINGHPVPSFSIMADAKSLLHKRTDWVMQISNSPSDIKFLMKHIDGVIGSAYQTAHLIDVYELLGDQYIQELSQIMLRFYATVHIEITRDDEGKPIEFFLNLGSERSRYAGKTGNIRAWLKSHRYPRYMDIMRIWMKPPDPDNSKMTKDYKKLLSWNPVLPYRDQALYWTIDMRRRMYDWIPNHVARALPEFRGVDPTFGMRNPDYVIERFVWLSLYHKLGCKVPAVALFRTRLRENPYGSACDPQGFLAWLSNSNHLDELVQSNLEAHRAQMVAVTIVYWFLETFFKIFKDLPVLALIYNLYAFSTRDINRLYAALNYVYMLATGASSSVISNMMPPDPYAWMKRFSVVMTYIFPRRWYHALLPGVQHIVKVLPLMVELWAAGDAIVGPRPFRSLMSVIEVPSQWTALVAQFRSRIQDPADLAPLLIVAPTGTGKSTGFIAALLYNCEITGTVWLLCPTISARDMYQNSFLPDGYFQILSSGVENRPECRVKILTYGHARNRVPVEAQPNDLIILDEIHIGAVEMIACWYLFSLYKRIMITATITSFMPTVQPGDRFTYPEGRRFEVQVDPINGDFPAVVEEIIKTDIRLMDRALIMCPDYATTHDVIQTLGRISIVCSSLSSYEPIPARSGCIAATTIADQAITIEPPPTCLIDLGKTLKITYDFRGFMPSSSAAHVPTSPATAIQRLGRVGRAGQSRAFVMPEAGTGQQENPTPTAFSILNDPSLRENLAMWFHLSVLVDIITAHENIFAYVRPSVTTNIGDTSPHTVALTFYIFARMSDNQFGESLWMEWLELKVARSQHEIINITMDNVLDLGYGDPLLGDWPTALNLVASGFLSVSVNGTLKPASCLVNVANSIVYCGCSLNMIAQFLPMASAQVGYIANDSSAWHDFAYITHISADVTTMYNAVNIENMTVSNLSSRDEYEGSLLAYHDVQALAFAQATRAINFPGRPPQRYELVRIYINEDIGDHVEAKAILLSTSQEYGYIGLNIVEVSDYSLGPHAIDFGLVLQIAAAAHDRQIIVYGDVPVAAIRLLDTFHSPAMMTNPERSWLIISPRYARRFFHGLQWARRALLEPQYLNSIPKRVLLTGRLVQYEAMKAETKVYLNEAGHLAGIA
jgi:hypothetical protein